MLRNLWFKIFPRLHPITPMLRSMRKQGATIEVGYLTLGDGSKYEYKIERTE